MEEFYHGKKGGRRTITSEAFSFCLITFIT